ncbi:hypothetical protein B7P43_G03809 [Cryptotermes secundus]|uniref:Uncharacterized protein n=1 Tax=Cryptotermes secundus TaxID=105785 RepID=A0A2J7QAI2_9NEOP|nr:uncharacterized protein LOC111868762 [Cryptotermes secundus]PNF25601.1 hypothetical protein B7P43_G03809 [Cryptotermes secundus]
MEEDKEKCVVAIAKCASYQAVPGYTGQVKIPDTGFDKSKSSDTKLEEVVHNAKSESHYAFILAPLNANTAKPELTSPNVLCNTSNVSIYVTAPYYFKMNAGSTCNVNQPTESCNAADISAQVIVSKDTDSKMASDQPQCSHEDRKSAVYIVAALLQNEISPFQSENNKYWPSEIQEIISRHSCTVEHIFATSSEAILITFPCTPGFEKDKVGPADRSTVKCGSSSSFGLTDECMLEKKFNILFHHLSTGLMSNLSPESAIKRFLCYAMNDIMEVMSIEYALSLVCNCSLCWYLYMCAKVIYRDSPEETPKLNWSGCAISSYRCLAMRKICVTDRNSKAVGQDSSINCSFTLPLRFTRGGKKRKLHDQREFKPLKRNMVLLDSNLNKVPKVTARTCDSAVAPSCSFSSDLNKVSEVTVRQYDSAVVPSSSFRSVLNKVSKVTARTYDSVVVPAYSLRVKPDHVVKTIGLGFKGCPRFQSPEEDAYVFNPVRQFKGNTYTRKKNSGVR